jgi:xylan 1,4-beta-xylosidase
MAPASRPSRARTAADRFRLPALPASDVWHAHSTFTLHVVGSCTTVAVALVADGLKPGDMAGLALFDRPYAWLAVERQERGFALVQFDERTGQTTRLPLGAASVHLRAECDLGRGHAEFQYSTDGTHYAVAGVPYEPARSESLPRTIRCAVFCVAASPDSPGGYAYFSGFEAVTVSRAAPSSPGEPVRDPRCTRARAGRSRDS